MLNRRIIAIARFTLLEALRTRLPWLFIIVLALILGCGYLIQQLAITESERMQIAFCAAAMRVAAVFILSLHVINSVVRELNDKGLELALSSDLPRSHYILGRLLGFATIALAAALLAALPMVFLAAPATALRWGISLTLELAVIAALSLFCIVTFTQLMPAASFVCGFYLLARTITAIRMMSDAPLTGAGTWSHQVMSLLISTLAYLLPTLDHYAQTSWLIGNPVAWSEVTANAVQAALYVTVLIAATMFDFYRRSL